MARIGIAVDSSQLEKGTTSLKAFNQEAQKTPSSVGAVEAAAKRAGISVEEYRKRMAAAGQTNTQFEGTASKAAKGAASQREQFELLSRAAFVLPGPLGAIIRDLGALTVGSTRLSLGLIAGVTGFAAVTAGVVASVAA